MLPQLTSVLEQYWGHRAFRPMQEEIVQSVLDGRDTLAILPTGGGKSICFQVPTLVTGGLCLVVSPLIALMKDQVEHLRKKGITAFAVYSGMTWKEVKNILNVASESNCRFLYVSPERLETALFREFLPSFGITLIAVDDHAHRGRRSALHLPVGIRFQTLLFTDRRVAGRASACADPGAHRIRDAGSTKGYL
jgi:ATP-dependent DNA helicase RecQ